MNEKSKNSLKGLAIGVAGVFAVTNALSSGMETWRVLAYGALALIYLSAPYWWGRLEASE